MGIPILFFKFFFINVVLENIMLGKERHKYILICRRTVHEGKSKYVQKKPDENKEESLLDQLKKEETIGGCMFMSLLSAF